MSASELQVSIVIVCMNNLKNLYPCLNSIRKYTSVSYETFVVAYLFSKENLEKVKRNFPWVTFIESNEIRGFSENNNLALRQAKGKYCFVLNDDTFFEQDVLGRLVDCFNNVEDDNAAIISPVLLNRDRTIQVCGRPPFKAKEYVLSLLHLWSEKDNGGKYINQKGVFRTYNIIGAAFLGRTDILRKFNYFDEYYYFCPEDIALSTKLNNAGYHCYVDSNAKLVHLGGGSGNKNVSKIKMATMPAGEKGSLRFFSGGNVFKQITLGLFVTTLALLKSAYYKVKSKKAMDSNDIIARANWNVVCSLLTSKTPKQIFCKYYSSVK